jgi:hypothetical protein
MPPNCRSSTERLINQRDVVQALAASRRFDRELVLFISDDYADGAVGHALSGLLRWHRVVTPVARRPLKAAL